METNELSARLAACGMSEVQFRADQLEATVSELTLVKRMTEHDDETLLTINQIAGCVESYALDVVFEYLQVLSPPMMCLIASGPCSSRLPPKSVTLNICPAWKRASPASGSVSGKY